MKYLKYFESEYYEELTDDKMATINFSEVQGFDKNEFTLIESLCRKYNCISGYSKSSEESKIEIDVYMNSIIIAVIYKFQDEWYFVQDYDDYKYYTCDQIGGLLECLLDILSKCSLKRKYKK